VKGLSKKPGKRINEVDYQSASGVLVSNGDIVDLSLNKYSLHIKGEFFPLIPV